MVKLVDLYPDGREILLREAAAMARYRDGCDRPAPLEPGATARLAFDCNSIAAVFNTGHRLGVFITSSSHPAYEVHPNTYGPAQSAADMKPANQTIRISPATPSAIILPGRAKRSGHRLRQGSPKGGAIATSTGGQHPATAHAPRSTSKNAENSTPADPGPATGRAPRGRKADSRHFNFPGAAGPPAPPHHDTP